MARPREKNQLQEKDKANWKKGKVAKLHFRAKINEAWRKIIQFTLGLQKRALNVE